MLPLASNTPDENDWEKKADKESPVSEKRETDRKILNVVLERKRGSRKAVFLSSSLADSPSNLR